MAKTYNIALIPGDGTGPEVVAEGIKVLAAVAHKEGFNLNYTTFDFGGDRYLKTGEVLPDSAADELRKFDAIYLGAIGHPDVKPGILEKGILLRLRFELDQYINLRPVKLYPGVECPLKDKGPEHIDFVVVRENTEGLYAGAGGFLKKGTADEVAIQESINGIKTTNLPFAARQMFSPMPLTSGKGHFMRLQRNIRALLPIMPTLMLSRCGL
jgi:3-isopropylmalate dehydrogenase